MSESDTIRVLLVDDHDMVRRGLATILKTKPDLELAGEARNGQEAIMMCEHTNPDVVLMDLIMPEMEGHEATRKIRERCPQVQVIALTSFQEQDLVEKALQAGAISYLLKNVTAEELARAIRAAHAGRPTLAPEATEALIRSTQQGPPPGHDLTTREREVLGLLVEGFTNQEIADHITVSLSTARAHVSNILSKLGVSNRAEAVALALRNKLIT